MPDKHHSMAKVPKPKPKATLEVAVEGEGLGLADVNIRLLAQLLEATASTLDAVAAEAGLQPVVPSLGKARAGSAAYVLGAEAEQWPEVVRSFRSVVKTRGAESGPVVRHGLLQMQQVGAKLGAVRISTSLDGPDDKQPLYLATPLEPVLHSGNFTTTLYGRVVGVNEYARGMYVHLRLMDGRQERLAADDAIAEKAGRQFRQKVRVDATAVWDEERETNWEVRSIDAWQDDDLLEALEDVHSNLEDEGVSVDVDGWVRDLD